VPLIIIEVEQELPKIGSGAATFSRNSASKRIKQVTDAGISKGAHSAGSGGASSSA
jgi:hypothetical protein